MPHVQPGSALDRLAVLVVAVATALVIVTASIAPFLTPAFVTWEQGRADAAAWTRMAPADQQAVTESILGDLVLWRGDFDVMLQRFQILDDAERGHMRDVRRVFTGLWVAGLAAALVLAGVGSAARSRPALAARLRRGIGLGARGLAVGIVVAGAFALVAFDAAFEVFHRLFFAAGTYDFDPATSHLVQLFPEAFWSETALLVGGVILLVAVVVAVLGGRRGPSTRAVT